MSRHVSFRISIPEGMFNEITNYCNKTQISKSKYATKLLEDGLRCNQLPPIATIRSTVQ